MRIAVNGHQITIYGIYDLRIKAKDNYNITRSTKFAFYVTNIVEEWAEPPNHKERRVAR
jgi:hypothetical protein